MNDFGIKYIVPSDAAPAYRDHLERESDLQLAGSLLNEDLSTPVAVCLRRKERPGWGGTEVVKELHVARQPHMIVVREHVTSTTSLPSASDLLVASDCLTDSGFDEVATLLRDLAVIMSRV